MNSSSVVPRAAHTLRADSIVGLLLSPFSQCRIAALLSPAFTESEAAVKFGSESIRSLRRMRNGSIIRCSFMVLEYY